MMKNPDFLHVDTQSWKIEVDWKIFRWVWSKNGCGHSVLRTQKFSHLNEHKFCHNFKDSVVPMCDCGKETETAEHFFLRCPFFVTERQKLLNNIYDKHFSSQNLNEESMIHILLCVCDRFNERDNKEILLHRIDYIKSTKRFERPLIDHCLL